MLVIIIFGAVVILMKSNDAQSRLMFLPLLLRSDDKTSKILKGLVDAKPAWNLLCSRLEGTNRLVNTTRPLLPTSCTDVESRSLLECDTESPPWQAKRGFGTFMAC